MTDLGDRSHMDDVVEAPVAAPRNSRNTLRRPPEDTSIGAVPL